MIRCAPLYPDSKVHGVNMVPIWGRQDPGGPHVGPMNFVIWVCYKRSGYFKLIGQINPMTATKTSAVFLNAQVYSF